MLDEMLAWFAQLQKCPKIATFQKKRKKRCWMKYVSEHIFHPTFFGEKGGKVMLAWFGVLFHPTFRFFKTEAFPIFEIRTFLALFERAMFQCMFIFIFL